MSSLWFQRFLSFPMIDLLPQGNAPWGLARLSTQGELRHNPPEADTPGAVARSWTWPSVFLLTNSFWVKPQIKFMSIPIHLGVVSIFSWLVLLRIDWGHWFHLMSIFWNVNYDPDTLCKKIYGVPPAASELSQCLDVEFLASLVSSSVAKPNILINTSMSAPTLLLGHLPFVRLSLILKFLFTYLLRTQGRWIVRLSNSPSRKSLGVDWVLNTYDIALQV